jgi:hypothetical protein
MLSDTTQRIINGGKANFFAANYDDITAILKDALGSDSEEYECDLDAGKKVFEYLYVPMSAAKDGFDNISERILCLVDTDELCVDLNVESSTRNQSLVIRRFNENQSHSVEFKTIEDPNRTPTEIEDILYGPQFYITLQQLIAENANESIKEAFDAFEFDENVVGSRIKGDYSILNHKGLGRSIRKDKETIIDFINSNKDQIAERYTQLPNSDHTPAWVSWIEDFFAKK